MKTYNSIIGFSANTTQMLYDLEELGCPNVKVVKNSDDCIAVNFCKNPTYADVFEWLHDKGYYVYIEPVSTMSTKDHNAWMWHIVMYNPNDAYNKLSEHDNEMYMNWNNCADNVIKRIITMIKDED